MLRLPKVRLPRLFAILAVGFISASAPTAATLIFDGIAFTYPHYDYAPSAMFDGGRVKIWWCRLGFADEIAYREFDGTAWSTGQIVMKRTVGSWDDQHVCDPNVVKGSFSYGGNIYSYAMYYTGADLTNNSLFGRVGVAFSNDGVTWNKYPAPVMFPVGGNNGTYGAGMPSFYRQQGTASSGWLVWYDSTWPGGPANLWAYTTNGINFGAPQVFATEAAHGLIGDVAWNVVDQLWYITTMGDPGQTRVDVHTSPNPATSPWTLVGSLGPSQTGGLRNHNPGFLRQPNGDLTIDGTGTKYLAFGTGSGDPATWDIGFGRWF